MIRNTLQAAMKPSDLKLSNRMQILELFKSGAPLSAGAVAEAVGISRQTVMKAIQFFVDKGILAPDGKAEAGSMGGKRAELFSLAADQYLFNVLICPDYLYISLFNYRCEVVDNFTQRGIAPLDAEEIIRIAGTACYKLLLNNGIPQGNLRGLCVSTSGIVDHRTNVLKFNSLLPNWGRDIPIAEKLAAYFDGGVLALAENVGKVCGSAFLHSPEFQDKRGMTVFSAWGGVCACQMARGRILNGKDALIGEIGHMVIAPTDTEVCGCGSRGCFERQVSDSRIRRLAAELAPDYPASELAEIPLEAITARDVFRAAARGDALARALDERLARCFAAALRNITLTFNPDLVVFQGDYAEADDGFRQVLAEELNTFHYYNARSPFQLQMDGRSIRDLATLGAYTLLIDRLFSDEAVYG